MIYSIEDIRAKKEMTNMIDNACKIYNTRGEHTLRTIKGGSIYDLFDIRDFLRGIGSIKIPCLIKVDPKWRDQDILLADPKKERRIYGYRDIGGTGYVTLETIDEQHSIEIPVSIITKLTVPKNLKVMV